MASTEGVVTAQASPNIAFIKYWGKRDEERILPQNSSLSMTLSSAVLNTTTSVMASEKIKGDTFYLNGKKLEMNDNETKERLKVISMMRALSGSKAGTLIVSSNNFPSSSGLASSASGTAALVYALNAAFNLKMNPRELSIMARQGSGSACRSMMGGIVSWKRGIKDDGSDSYAVQEFNEKYWPEVIDLIAIASHEKKKIPSRAGMRQTVETNPLFMQRRVSAEKRLEEVLEAYRKKDFNALASLIMADSNEMHALMLSTIPSIRYLNPSSLKIMDAIEELNAAEGKNIAGYTFDAGPNAHIITLKTNRRKITDILSNTEGLESLEFKSSPQGSGPELLKETSLIDTDTLAPA